MYNEAIRGVYYLRIREKTLSQICVLEVVLVLESKALYYWYSTSQCRTSFLALPRECILLIPR